IRGHRIELGEIEQALDAIKSINSAIVLLHDDQLIAYVISANGSDKNENQAANWKEILKDQLPAHMIPQHFVLVKDFPTTLSGKVDRKALLNLLPNTTAKIGFTAPATPSEKTIANIWQE